MIKSFFLKAVIALMFAFGVSTHVYSQIHLGDTLSLSPVFGGGDIIPHHPHKAPANSSLPICVFDGSSLLFTGTGNASFTYSVVDESDEVCLSGDITLYSGQETSVSVASLSAGGYYLIIAVAGREYEGEFTIE